MSRYKRFIKWLLFGSFPASQPLDALDTIQNSEKKNELTISRIDFIGSFLLNHLFGISNRAPSTSFESETCEGTDGSNDAGNIAWRRADYLDADIDSYEIGGELGGFEEVSPIFNNDDHFYRACGVNPANGLPMLDDCIDIHGNPYGTDFSDSGSALWGDNSLDSFGCEGFNSTASFDIFCNSIMGSDDPWGF